MLQLALGLGAFSVPHLWKRIAPASRARLGEAGKGVVALLAVGGVWLMARGYGAWDDAAQLWQPAGWLRWLSNALVLLAFYLFLASGARTAGARWVRHPQLSAVATWAVAHLLVNGDLASVVLFGGLLLWAAAAMLLINAREPRWAPPPPAPAGKEAVTWAAAVLAFAAVGWLHGYLGPWPFAA